MCQLGADTTIGAQRFVTTTVADLYERAVCIESIEVVVKNGLADDVQCQLTEAGLHIY